MLALLLIACGGDTAVEETPKPEPVEAPAPAPMSDVDKAVAVSKAIAADPGNADAALKEHGMTEADYRALVFKIAQDAGMSSEYASKM